MKIDWKNFAPYLVAFVLFLIAAAIYFQPALEGKVIYAGDNINAIAANKQCWNYNDSENANTFWNDAVFSGMPNYQMGGHTYLNRRILGPVYTFFHLGERNMFFTFFFYLLAFFALLRSFQINTWHALAGAFAIAMSSYFFIIIAAAHFGKTSAIMWMALVLAGLILIFRKKYILGSICIMFFLPMGFFNHPQMGYYICMLIGVMYLAELTIHIQERRWKDLGIGTLIFALSFLIGFGAGSADVFANQEYAEQTMRGGHSDLAKASDETNKTKGLDLDYATAWSYGKAETMTLLIPNWEGGSSGYNLGKDSQLSKAMRAKGVPKRDAENFCAHAPTYHGEKMFTSGAVYVGAVVCFLFLLGMLIVPGPYKWALLFATLMSILLAWGHNFMGLTKFFFTYFPMYNKFRAPESILIVAEITMPLLGFLGLRHIADKGIEWPKLRNSLFIAGGVTAAICLFAALFAGSFDMTSTYDAQWKEQVPNWLYDAILDQRTAMMRADAWRSLIFVLLGFGLTYWYANTLRAEEDEKKQRSKTVIYSLILCALIVADLWAVDKRFCNDSYFVSTKDRDKSFRMTDAEKQILQDPTHFRVLNLTSNTFNEARTSYYLKSIGGYSAAKLRRYQDLIDEHISKMNWNVLNMLNTKYIITQQGVYPNPEAMGNVWLVDQVALVNNANDESDALKDTDLRRIAVADSTYAPNKALCSLALGTADAADYIELTSAKMDKLNYYANVQNDRLAVFSEIYYPYGWHASIDGKPAEHFRVNYMLRAMLIPAGEHQIEFVFRPESVHKGEMLSLVCVIITLLVIVGGVGYAVYRRRKTNSK